MKIKHTALLSRLSKEDELSLESESIQTQKAMLEEYASSHGFKNIIHYSDDGYSGTSFDRPDFKRLVSDIECGIIDTVIVKDLSRLGRDYLKTGYYIEEFFPKYNVRFIALNDDVDSNNGISDFTPFKNIMNEWYAKDISKKIKSAYRIKALKGEFTASYAPYGYIKDPNDKHHLIIDYEVSYIVKEIFEMASIGKSSFEIASILTKRKILKPRCYMYTKYKTYSKDIWNEHPYDWRARTIAKIIENYEYCGHMVSNKNYKVSYKSKRLLPTDKKDWIIVKNTHDAIISEDLFNKANERIKRRKRVFKNKERNMFSGIIRCATCGKALSLFNGAKGVSHFACSQYRSFGKAYCTCHYIRYDTLCKTVEDDIRYHINLVTNDKDKLIKDLLAKYNINNQVSIDFKRLERRKEELKVILKRMYEDMILGKVSEIMYNEISKEYEIELTKISDKIEEFSKLNKDRNELGNSITKFIDEVSKYSLNDSLSKELLNKLIKEIRVHESEVIDGKRVQNVEIIYNFMP